MPVNPPIISYQIAVGKQSGKQAMKKSFWSKIALFCGLFTTPFVYAMPSFSPEQVGMGGAGVARMDSSGQRNAASMMLMPGLYSFTEVGWGQGFSFGEAVREVRVDSAFGASLAYGWQKSDLPASIDEMPGWILPGEELSNSRKTQDLRAAGGLRLLGGRLGVGGGLRYLRDNSELAGVVPVWDLDLSVAGLLAERVSLALGVQNLLPESPDSVAYELGLWWSAAEGDPFSLALDAIWKDGSAEGRAGIDFALAEPIRVRGGYAFSDQSQRVGLGLGFLGEGTRIDYAFSMQTSGSDEGERLHHLALFLAVPSTQ